MNTRDSTAAAHGFLSTFGETAHRVVNVYRDAGERLAVAADQRWTTAFAQSSPKLSKETRQNAKHARDVVATYYAKGLEVSARGAGTAIDGFVEIAAAAVEKAAAVQKTYAARG